MTRRAPSPATCLHVERTADPAVMRWVVHDAGVAAAGDGSRAPAGASALAALVGTGAVADVAVMRGHVLVRATDAATWPRLAPSVHAAVAADLASRAGWLTEPAVTAVPVSVRSRA